MPTVDGKFTETEAKMLAILEDGLPHRYKELLACLWDEDGGVVNMQQHISNIRKIINRQGIDILCVARQNTKFYQMVRLIRKER